MLFLKRFNKHFELVFWVSALILLFFMNPQDNEHSLCLFHWLGFDWCPGCGIGHAIHAALHFQFINSFQQHPMGIVALIIIINRIKHLSFKFKPLIS